MNNFFARMWVALVKRLHGVSMPMRWRLARIAAAILWFAVPKRRHVILTNLRLCFPELTEDERIALANAFMFVLDERILTMGRCRWGRPRRFSLSFALKVSSIF